jgi:hypothetical protein
MDCTFKLNKNEFPLVVIGVTDGAQQLHVLSLWIFSHGTTAMYLKVVSKVLPQVTFMPAYVMTDTELAERRALLSVFPEAQPLMSYFHVKKACEDKLRGNIEKELILQDIGDLYSTLTQEEFETKFSMMFNRSPGTFKLSFSTLLYNVKFSRSTTNTKSLSPSTCMASAYTFKLLSVCRSV